MMKMHRHIWKIISKEEQLSPWENMTKLGATSIDWRGDPRDAHRKDIIVRSHCDICKNEKIERI